MPDAMAMVARNLLCAVSVLVQGNRVLYGMYYGVFSVIKGTVGDLPSMNPPHTTAHLNRESGPQKMVVQGSDQAAEIGRGSTANQ